MRFHVFFNDTATTEIYTLSLHDALPIFCLSELTNEGGDHMRTIRVEIVSRTIKVDREQIDCIKAVLLTVCLDRKSTRLNSSHANISYAVFCLNKNKADNQRRMHSDHTIR